MNKEIICSINKEDDDAIKLDIKNEENEQNPEINPLNLNEKLIDEINKEANKEEKKNKKDILV